MATINGTSGVDTLNGTVGNDVINGFAGNDFLYGFEGDDLLDGGTGADTMQGGDGNDTYTVDNADDKVTESSATGGIDLVKSSISFALGANLENLMLTDNAANAAGNALNNSIWGNSFSNVLNGGAGADTMRGGDGNDTYVVDNSGDRAIEVSASSGTDLVKSSISLALGAYLENLELSGAAAINGTGNTLDNSLWGNSAANVLNGAAGVDIMRGGAGNDTYIVENAGDRAYEGIGAGTDLVRSSVSFTLGANIENLELSGAGAVNATGNALDNSLWGNGAANVLSGGDGIDLMRGGAGDDAYVVDNAGDRAYEGSAAGNDVVLSYVTFTLGANVERLTLLGPAAINGTGNILDNSIQGNGANNILSGGDGNDTLNGGGGTDTLNGGNGNDVLRSTGAASMFGGAGNDTYFVNAFTTVTEKLAEGTDTARAAIDYILPANVENGILENVGFGLVLDGNILNNVLTGNAFSDTLYGEGGNDTLNGGGGGDTLIGGAGDDAMAGGAGDDTYYVDSTADQVTELADSGTDTVLSFLASYALTSNVEHGLIASASGASLTGNDLANILTGGDGSDTLIGLGGADVIDAGGGAGNDTIDGGTGADTMTGGAGDDTYYVNDLGDVVTEEDGGGTDTLHSAIWGYQLPIFVENGSITNGTLYGNEMNNILTIEDAGSLYGNGGNDALIGSANADYLDGGYGDDTMSGGTGNDTYWVRGFDTILENAGEGDDTAYIETSGYVMSDNLETAVVSSVYARYSNMTITGGSTDNRIVGMDGNDTLNGGGGNDVLIGGGYSDTLNGGDGDDTLYGDYETFDSFLIQRADVLSGGDGNDTIYGRQGDDRLTGGAGVDSLYGELGLDTFAYTAVADSTAGLRDTIQDFTSGQDKIDMSAIDANNGVIGDQAFSYSAFSTGVAGQIWWVPAGGGHYTVYADVNGGGADFQLDVVTSGLSSADFIF